MFLQPRVINRFMKLNSPSGYQRVGFFPRKPIVTEFDVSEASSVTGYLSFRYLTVNATPYGVIFECIRAKTDVKDYALKVGITEELPDSFEPLYLLEKLGILMFLSNDSSILAIPSDISSSLLVRAE